MNDLHDQGSPSIAVMKDGPLKVSGAIPLMRAVILADPSGDSIGWSDPQPVAAPDDYFLCRCGQSQRKPFCDGSHAKIKFDGTETASREPFAAQVEIFEGPRASVRDVRLLCAGARFCDRDGTVWKTVRTVRDDEDLGALVSQVGQCPSGRLVVWTNASNAAVDQRFPKSILLIGDPYTECAGPIALRGRIEVTGADGSAYEIRDRVTLCRCGKSSNKPFCDGSHIAAKFQEDTPL